MKKIAITGSMGTGKTTLVNDLHKKLHHKDYVLLPEVARLMIGKGYKLDLGVTPELEILMAQYQQDQEKGEKWIADRCLIDILAYCIVLFPENYILEKSIRNFLKDSPYDLVVYVPIEFSIEDDGVRITDIDFQKRVDEEIKNIVFTDYKDVLEVRGSREERVEKILKVINKTI